MSRQNSPYNGLVFNFARSPPIGNTSLLRLAGTALWVSCRVLLSDLSLAGPLPFSASSRGAFLHAW